MFRPTLLKKLILIFVVVFSIPIIVSLIIINVYAVNFSRANTCSANIKNLQNTARHVDSFFGNIYDVSLHLSLHDDIIRFLSVGAESIYRDNQNVSAQKALSTLPHSNPYVKSVIIVGNDDRFLSSGSQVQSITESEKRYAKELNGAPYWSVEQTLDVTPRIALVRLVRNPNRLADILGYMKISFNNEAFSQLFTPQSTSSEQAYLLVDENGEILMNTGILFDTWDQTAVKVLQQTSPQVNRSLYHKESDAYITSINLQFPEWTLYSVSDNAYTNSLSSALNQILLISMLLCFIFCLLLSLAFGSVIVAPLKKLGHLMNQIEREDFSARFYSKRNDEIGVLARQFDAMSQRLNTLYNEIYINEINLKEAQLSVLQAQINPHFLYNTLDTIYWVSEFNHIPEISKMVSSLSRLFQLSLSGDKHDMVPLKNEIEHVQCYLDIQQIRYQERLTYTLSNRLEHNDFLVLKLILQPLVENAILHGIDQVGSGHIDIVLRQENTCLIYQVKDSAALAQPDHINAMLNGEFSTFSESVTHKKGIGLRNIHERIILRYGKQYGIHCAVTEQQTVFTVRLPLTPPPQHNENA